MAQLADTTVNGNINVTGKVKEKGADLIPSGLIAIWTGTLTSIPDGWLLCDGTNSTPDLRDRFIVGSPSATNPGSTGGASSQTLSVANMPTHTHSGTSNITGSHSHTYRHPNYTSGGSWGSTSTINTATDSYASGWDGSHSHTVTLSNAGSGTAFDNRPAYYTVAYIMKR